MNLSDRDENELATPLSLATILKLLANIIVGKVHSQAKEKKLCYQKYDQKI